MKKQFFLLLAALLLLPEASAFAQFFADAGYIHAMEIQYNKNTKTSTNNSYDGAYAGGKFHIDLSSVTDGLALEPGVNMAYLFGKYDYFRDNDIINEYEITLNVPLHALYALEPSPDFKLYAYAGPTFQYGIWNRGVDGDDNPAMIYNNYKTIMLPGAPRNMAARNRFNVLLGVGVGMEISERVRIGAGYDFGALNLSTDPSLRLLRHQFEISAGYFF